MNKYREVIFVQEGELLNECDTLFEGVENVGTIYSDMNSDSVIDLLSQYNYGEGEIVDTPYICKNGTDYQFEKDNYLLLYNSTVGGVYSLYEIISK